ncbi:MULTISPECIES: rhodanese-like domain-containing protein [Pseudodesulfovibrio]|nr:rhodanese-related sulfurtransferase [Pseudodesulfovibrio indicus]
MLRRVLLLCVCAVLLAAVPATAGLFGDKFEDEVVTETSAVKLVREVQQGGYDVVTTEELKGWIDGGRKMIIVDTMPFEASYAKGHIPGAVPFEFPVPLMETWDTTKTAGKSPADYEALLGSDKDMLIVVYCGFVKCTRSHNGAIWAKKLGYTNVVRHPGGIFAWKGKGYPVETAE